MRFMIAETEEIEELRLEMGREEDCLSDVMYSSATWSDITCDEDPYAYRISKNDFDWWAEYTAYAAIDLKTLDDLYDEYGRDDVEAIVEQCDLQLWASCDYNDHHNDARKAFACIRKMLGDEEDDTDE